jgi:hypothetical protein
MARRHRLAVTFPAALAVGLAISSVPGCARRAPEPVYSEPPPQRSLRITAQRKQSQRQQDRDKADCQQMASGQATSSDSWAQIFTSCMGGRGYMID